MLHLTIYVKNLKKNDERYRTIQSIFLKINLSFCVDIHFVSWCMYWIIAYFYILDIIYMKYKISVTLQHVDANYANWDFFNTFFVNIQSLKFN